MTARHRHRYDRATANLDPPLAIVDLDAFRANAADLVRRAGDKPIRVASKSLRVRQLIARALGHDAGSAPDGTTRPGFTGVMAFSLAEALWLAQPSDSAQRSDPAAAPDLAAPEPAQAAADGPEGRSGTGEPSTADALATPEPVEDVLVGYPTVDRNAIARLGASPRLAERITLTFDDIAQLDLVQDVLGPHHPEIRLCLDIDTSWRPLGAWVGARRSPVRSTRDAVRLAREVAERPGFRLVGVLTYEAQVAGTQDGSPAVRVVKRRSMEEIRSRRAELIRAVREVAELEFVNAGGTGSLEASGADPWVDELTAGSGLLGPALFDGYRDFRPRPAALLAFPVVRRPADRVATVYSGGWIASGPAGRDRSPVPELPRGLRLSTLEGAGEVQTPVLGEAACDLEIGDRVWFRHAKSGEPFEHLDSVHLVETDRVVATVPSYRGEGRTFGV